MALGSSKIKKIPVITWLNRLVNNIMLSISWHFGAIHCHFLVTRGPKQEWNVLIDVIRKRRHCSVNDIFVCVHLLTLNSDIAKSKWHFWKRITVFGLGNIPLNIDTKICRLKCLSLRTLFHDAAESYIFLYRMFFLH